MVELDFSNIYNSSGKIVQLRYAEKAAEAGSTIIALSCPSGAVLIASKPHVSDLYVHESDHRIKKISEHLYMAYTGLLSDGFFMTDICKKAARNYLSNYHTEITSENFKETLGNYLYMFTQYNSTRIIGANFLSIMKEKEEYKVFGAECSGVVRRYRAYAAGLGKKRAQTEIESLKFDSMNVNDLIRAGIKTLYKCYDPLSDPKFNIEVGYMSEDTDGSFKRLDQESIDAIVEEYKDITVDGED